MDLEEAFATSPFMELLGIELLETGDGTARGRVEFTEELSATAGGEFLQGGLVFTLADALAGVAVATRTGQRSVTVDMRIDYFAPAVTDLYAEAVVRRMGDSVVVADIDITDPDGEYVATARGTFWAETGYQFDEVSSEPGE